MTQANSPRSTPRENNGSFATQLNAPPVESREEDASHSRNPDLRLATVTNFGVLVDAKRDGRGRSVPLFRLLSFFRAATYHVMRPFRVMHFAFYLFLPFWYVSSPMPCTGISLTSFAEPLIRTGSLTPRLNGHRSMLCTVTFRQL